MPAPRKGPKVCDVCGGAYLGILRSRYCSKACKQKRDHDTRRALYAEDPAFRAKVHEDVARWRRNNPERHRAIRRRAWGIKDATGERKVGPCQVCGQHTDPLHLDHDHKTGLARGWLCTCCNTAIGKLRDDPKLCEAAARYLRESK